MSAIFRWFSGKSADSNDYEKQTDDEHAVNDEEEEKSQLMPPMTDDELEKYKFEKTKKLRREQLDVIFSTEASIRSTIKALQKSLQHYSQQRLEIYGKRQKYRLMIAKYNGPDDEEKMAAIKEILHRDLPSLIEELNSRIDKSEAQLNGLEKQLDSLSKSRRKAERAYARMFEPHPDGDLEAGNDTSSDDEDEKAKNVPIEYILSKWDPVNFPPKKTEVLEYPKEYAEDADELHVEIDDSIQNLESSGTSSSYNPFIPQTKQKVYRTENENDRMTFEMETKSKPSK